MYDFPRFVTPSRPAVAARINRQLCIELLEVDPDTARDNTLFNAVWGDPVNGWMPRLTQLEWTTVRPRPDLLEVDIDGESCGAYCEDFASTWLYDLRDGRFLPFDTLFTESGARVIKDTLHTLWTNMLLIHVDSMEQASVSAVAAPEVLDQFKAAVELYRNCLEERANAGAYVWRIRMMDEGIRFHIARCAPHVVRELDDLDPVSFVLPTDWCIRLMRPDSQELFR